MSSCSSKLVSYLTDQAGSPTARGGMFFGQHVGCLPVDLSELGLCTSCPQKIIAHILNAPRKLVEGGQV